MRGRRALAAALALGVTATAGAATLKQAFDAAGPRLGYDKYVVLETGVTYTGGLWIGATFDRITAMFEGGGLNVRIVGRGAILDLQGGEICIAYCDRRLDLDDCIILNGDVRYRGYADSEVTWIPTGSVRHVTFYGPHDYGVRMIYAGHNVLVERNLVVSAVDTGPDFMYLSGYANDWLPTGAGFGLSVQNGFNVRENWSWHADPIANADPLRHFLLMCDYG